MTIFFIFILLKITGSFDLGMHMVGRSESQKRFERFITPKSALDRLSMGGTNYEVNDSFLWFLRIARENNRIDKNQLLFKFMKFIHDAE